MGNIYEAYLALLFYDGREIIHGHAVLRVRFVKKNSMRDEEMKKLEEVKEERSQNSSVFAREY